MTYNIGYLSGMSNNTSQVRSKVLFEQNQQNAIDLIARYQPDLVGFQEIDFASDRSFQVNQADQIGELAGFYCGFHSVNWNKRYVPFPYGLPAVNFGEMLSGQSILSQYPLENTNQHILEKPVNAPFYYKAFYLDRLIQQADWLVGDQRVKVLNLHLEAFDKETRLIHAEAVKSIYLQYYKDFPVLILGDFNSRAAYLDDDAMRIIMSAPEIVSAIDQEQYESDSTRYFSYSSAKPAYMIDYILFNQSYIEKIQADVLSDAGQISDHLPVIFDFRLK